MKAITETRRQDRILDWGDGPITVIITWIRVIQNPKTGHTDPHAITREHHNLIPVPGLASVSVVHLHPSYESAVKVAAMLVDVRTTNSASVLPSIVTAALAVPPLIVPLDGG